MAQDVTPDLMPTGVGPEAELRAIGPAGTPALAVIRQATADGAGGAVSAIEAVFLVSDALEQLRGLRAAIPALLAAADPGDTIAADIKTRADELSALADQVAATRRELDLFKAREQETSERLAELSELRESVTELRRRERLAAVLQELSGQRQVIEQRLIVLRRLTQDQENTIGAGAGEVVTLAEDRRALLAAGVRDTLARAGEAAERLAAEEERLRTEEGRLADVRQRLEAARQRQADLAAERDGQLEQLAAHARADAALAAALSPVAPDGDPVVRLRAALDGIVSQLDNLDGALRDRVRAGQDDYDREHADVGWAAR
jgi:DNA repair exonuclease SbcCD ATPase subunit